ncbi:MAG: hypothetical protein JO040_06155 [Gemmatimonadetes bacterium]|nr:hypothetical protein [Gemmatimonadota bacterium]
MRAGTVRFVRADVGCPLEWIPEETRFAFWKAEVRGRVVDAVLPSFRLEDFPGERCYLASEWQVEEYPPVVLVEHHH